MSDLWSLTSEKAVRKFRDTFLGRIDNKTELILDILRSDRWDLVLAVITEAHCIGHRCWHIHDPAHPKHDAKIRAAIGDPLLDAYGAIDRALGRIIETVGQEAQVLVYLSHGMEARYSGTRLLDKILSALEEGPAEEQPSTIRQAVRRTWRALPDAARRPLWPLRNMMSKDGFQPNRTGRRYFEMLNNDRTGGIRLNVAGREALGVVTPGAEYDALCDWLIAELGQVVNAETGAPIASEVLKTRDFYAGEAVDHLPDVLITWNREAPINAASSPTIGMVRGDALDHHRSGDHRPYGQYYLVGTGNGGSSRNDAVRVEAFAPTVMAYFGETSDAYPAPPIAALLEDRVNPHLSG